MLNIGTIDALTERTAHIQFQRPAAQLSRLERLRQNGDFARVGTVLPARRGSAHDSDRRTDLCDDRRARHVDTLTAIVVHESAD